MLRFILYVFYMKQEKTNNRINIAPSVCKCFCANVAHITQCARVTIMDQRVWRKNTCISNSSNIILPPPPQKKTHSCLLCCCIKSVFKVQYCFFVTACGLSLIFTPSCVRANLRLRSPWRRCRTVQETRLAFIGVESSMSVCLWQREEVCFPPRILMFHVLLSKLCLQGGRVICPEDFFFTWFWYHVAWS